MLVLVATMLLLVTSAWFTLVGLRNPSYLYPSAAGNRIALKYADRLPSWWFYFFPDFTHIVTYSGSVNLTREAASAGGVQTSQAAITWSNCNGAGRYPTRKVPRYLYHHLRRINPCVACRAHLARLASGGRAPILRLASRIRCSRPVRRGNLSNSSCRLAVWGMSRSSFC